MRWLGPHRASSVCRLLIVTALVVGGTARDAHAQEGSSAALAQALFDEAITLMHSGQFHAACPKLRESMRLDPAGGTALDLAYCLENDGLLASAYAAYKDAEHFAMVDNRKDREAVAKERLSTLAPRVPRLSINAGRRPVTISLDGLTLGDAALETPLPIDPGTHRLVAEAAGLTSWSTVFDVTAGGVTSTIDIPPLVPAPPATTNGNERPPVAEARRWSTASKVLLVSGGVSLLSGLGFGAAAFATHRAADCGTNSCPSPRALELERRADGLAWVSNASFGAALVTTTLGLVLHFAAGPPKGRAGAPNLASW